MTTPGEELVDVIDEQGNTIGVVTRKQMRAERLPHRCVYLLVFNNKGELFVHQRTATKDVFPSCWDVTVGGVLSAGESFDAGAAREGAEELGVTLVPQALFPFHYADERTIVQGMVYRAMHEGPFRFQPEEVERGEFMPMEQLSHLVQTLHFCPDGLAVLAEFRRRLG